MASLIRVAVFMGGLSAEHDVSLRSGEMVLKYLPRRKYRVRGFVISRAGKWPITIAALKKNYDVVFIAMHGEYGEDGTLQVILEKHGVPFTGSRSAASRLGMDKAGAARVFEAGGILTPPPPAPNKFPVVIKPADRGSSVGVTIAKNNNELLFGLRLAMRYSANIIVQKFINGREFTCGVIEINGKARALPPTEIIPIKSKFFDYKAKYIAGGSQEITPPKINKAAIREIQRMALTVHRAIGARGFSRTDVIRDNRGRFYALEINTIPGLTNTSLLPQQAASAGISFPELLDLMICSALKKIEGE